MFEIGIIKTLILRYPNTNYVWGKSTQQDGNQYI